MSEELGWRREAFQGDQGQSRAQPEVQLHRITDRGRDRVRGTTASQTERQKGFSQGLECQAEGSDLLQGMAGTFKGFKGK